MTDRELVARIARSAGGKAGYKQLVRELGLAGGRERRLLLEQLARLTVRGVLAKLDREHWSIPRPLGTRENLAAGRLDLHRDGFGFVRPNARQIPSAGPRAGLARGWLKISSFLPMRSTAPCRATKCWWKSSRRRPMGAARGRIVRIMERRNPTVVGVFHYARSDRSQGHSVVPFDERMTQHILIPAGQELPAASETATPHRVLGSEATVPRARQRPTILRAWWWMWRLPVGPRLRARRWAE